MNVKSMAGEKRCAKFRTLGLRPGNARRQPTNDGQPETGPLYRKEFMTGKPPPKIRLFVATHKPWPVPDNALYVPIYVNGYVPDAGNSSLRDDTGSNIALRNAHYSELTAWYWVWKNQRDTDIVGLCHYRRYFFLLKDHPYFSRDKIYMEPNEQNLRYFSEIQPLDMIARLCSDGGVITPRPVTLESSISKHYRQCHRGSDWDAFLQAILETSPEHAKHIDFLDTSNQLFTYNMMVCNWRFFDDYFAAMMAVLEKTETMITYPEDVYQRRLPAFLSERFFSLHLHVTKTPITTFPIVLTDENAF